MLLHFLFSNWKLPLRRAQKVAPFCATHDTKEKKNGAHLVSHATAWHKTQKGQSTCRSLWETETSNSGKFDIVDINSGFVKYKHVITTTVVSSHLSCEYICVLFQRTSLCCSVVLKVSNCLSFFVWCSNLLLSHSFLYPSSKNVTFFLFAVHFLP